MAVTVQDPYDYPTGQGGNAGSGYQGANNPNSAQNQAGDYTQWTPAMAAANPLSNFMIQNGGLTPAEAAQDSTGAAGTWDKIATGVIDTGTNLGLAVLSGGAAAGALGGGTAAGIAGGAVGGAIGATGTDLANNAPVTGKSVAIGALGGAAGAAAQPLETGLNNATGIGDVASTALVKGGIGALAGGLAGGSTGAEIGGISGAASGGAGAASGSSGVGGAAGALAGYGATSMLGGNNTALQTGASGGSALQGAADSSNPYASLFGLAGTVLGGMAVNNQASMQNNAYTTAGNAANSGNQWGVSGLGGMGASFQNGQLGINGGALSPMAAGYGQYGQSQLGMANQYGAGGVPTNVTNGYNSYMGNLGAAQGYANKGQAGSLGMMNAGSNMFNSAGTNYNSAYNTALNSGLAALNPAIQQQSNALLNSNFERGMSGTSGGALQTQALQNSFNTADLQVQGNAVNQGLAAMNTTGNLGLGAYAQGAGQLGNFNNQSANLGSQGFNAGMGYSAFSPQLAGMYGANANSAVTGFGGINSMGLQNAQMGLASQTNVGNQMNRAATTQMQGANTYNGGLAGYGASMLGSPNFSGMAGGVGNSLSSLFGSGMNSSNLYGNGATAGMATGNMGFGMDPNASFGAGSNLNIPDTGYSNGSQYGFGVGG
jgi:hypothetical protein